jgi:hypothetical protein
LGCDYGDVGGGVGVVLEGVKAGKLGGFVSCVGIYSCCASSSLLLGRDDGYLYFEGVLVL